jgi:hypothetical protein
MRTKVKAGGGDAPAKAGHAPRHEDSRLVVATGRRVRPWPGVAVIVVVVIVVVVVARGSGRGAVLDPAHLQQHRALLQSGGGAGGGRR